MIKYPADLLSYFLEIDIVAFLGGIVVGLIIK